MSLLSNITVKPLTKTIVKNLYKLQEWGSGKLISKQVILGKNVRPKLQLYTKDLNRPIFGFQTAFKDGKVVKIKYLVPAKKEVQKISEDGYREIDEVLDYDKLIWTDYDVPRKHVGKIYGINSGVAPDFPEFDIFKRY